MKLQLLLEIIMVLQPTCEQQYAFQMFNTLQDLKINAFAGAGKTSTLHFMAAYTHRTGLYLAFNKSIVKDARQKFPRNVHCLTIHALAMSVNAAIYNNIPGKLTNSMNGNAVTMILGLQLKINLTKEFSLTPRSQGFLVLETIKKFMQSSDLRPALHHIPLHGKLQLVPIEHLSDFFQQVVHWANILWDKMIDPNDTAILGFEGILKLWALSNPVLTYDFILLDEAQDSNSVILDVLAKQNTQIIYVGDKHQQLYEWRGAVNAMDKIATPNTSYLTCSFRFGPVIADAATRILWLLGERTVVQGNREIYSMIGPCNSKTVLCRTNAGVISEFVSAVQAKKRPFIIGGTVELKTYLQSVTALKNGMPSDHSELFGFSSWDEVIEFSETPEGGHLRTIVNIVKTHDENMLKNFLELTPKYEYQADVVISTVHKAKGREWEYIRLANDYFTPRQTEDGFYNLNTAEVRLLYVAITRAKVGVELSESADQYLQIPFDKVILDSNKEDNNSSCIKDCHNSSEVSILV
jgi:hypothetical protein